MASGSKADSKKRNQSAEDVRNCEASELLAPTKSRWQLALAGLLLGCWIIFLAWLAWYD